MVAKTIRQPCLHGKLEPHWADSVEQEAYSDIVGFNLMGELVYRYWCANQDTVNVDLPAFCPDCGHPPAYHLNDLGPCLHRIPSARPYAYCPCSALKLPE